MAAGKIGSVLEAESMKNNQKTLHFGFASRWLGPARRFVLSLLPLRAMILSLAVWQDFELMVPAELLV